MHALIGLLLKSFSAGENLLLMPFLDKFWLILYALRQRIGNYPIVKSLGNFGGMFLKILSVGP